MIRLIHLADLHLGAAPSYLSEKAPDRNQDFLNAFSRAVAYALVPNNEIDLVIIAGDFFDSHNPDPETLRFAISELEKLKSADIPVILAPGNHDALGYSDCVYNTSDKLRRLVHLIESPDVRHNVQIDVKDTPVHFYGMAWNVLLSNPPYDSFKKEDLPGLHIAVIHGTLEGAAHFELHNRSVPLNPNNLATSGMDYIALGHIHSYQVRRAGDIPVVYPGTLEGLRFSAGELGEKYMVVVELVGGRTPKITPMKWNRRTIQRSSIDLDHVLLESEAELIEYIRGNIAGPNLILQLSITGSFPEVLDAGRLGAQLADDFFYLEIEDQIDVFNSAVIQEWRDEKSIRGMFVQKLQARLEAAGEESEREQLALALKLAAIALQTNPRGR